MSLQYFIFNSRRKVHYISCLAFPLLLDHQLWNINIQNCIACTCSWWRYCRL